MNRGPVPSLSLSQSTITTMVFLPLKPCCLKGQTLPGEPQGVMEAPNDKRTILRYHAKPKDGQCVDEKAALVLLYDAFGFKIVSILIPSEVLRPR
jgi:hypothetical protein